jgi:hypothetical protein
MTAQRNKKLIKHDKNEYHRVVYCSRNERKEQDNINVKRTQL